jgi:hypothetical protein
LGAGGGLAGVEKKVAGADGIRTRVWSLKGTCPRPLDDSAKKGKEYRAAGLGQGKGSSGCVNISMYHDMLIY